jgi:hypothetical protein
MIIATTFSLALSLSGCTKISETFDEGAAETESKVSLEEGALEKAQKVMRDFVEAVNLQNYDGITEKVYKPDNSFLNDTNIEWYISRSALADITGININKLDIEISEGALKKTATVRINKTGYQFEMELDPSNDWKVVLPELYVENWSIKIPKGCSVTIDNKSIEDYRAPSAAIDLYDTYTFPAIASNQTYEVKTTSTIYGDFLQKVTPKSDSESIPVICKINDAETASILRQIQSIWNGLYMDYKNGVDVSAIAKYFTDDFENTEMTNVLFTYFPALEMYSNDNRISYNNFYMKEAIPWTKDNYGCAILSSNESVIVNFGYRIDFSSSEGGSYNANKASTITMQYDQESSTYKIKTINDKKLFFENDYTTNDY